MRVANIIQTKIQNAFSPSKLIVEDESHKHAGHAGARKEGETHFRLLVVSDAFHGMSRVERHRHVTNVLKQEMGNPIHALSLKALTAEEAEKEDL
jgi:BolA protein